MANNSDQRSSSEGEDKGYAPQAPHSGSYGSDEMFQVGYPQQSAHENAERVYNTAHSYIPDQTEPDNQPQYEPGQQPSYRQQRYQQYQQYQQQPYDQQQAWYQQSSYGQVGRDVGPEERTSSGMKVRVAALLSCVFGWIGALIFLLIERENRYVRFNAMQSLLFFGAASVVQGIITPLPFLFAPLDIALGIVTFVVWIILLRATFQGRYYKLPVVGDYAERLIDSNMFR